MSILGHIADAQLPTFWGIFCAALAAAGSIWLYAMIRSGRFGRLRSIDRQPAMPIAFSMAIGLFFWIGTQVLYVGLKPSDHGKGPLGVKSLTVADWRFLSTVPALAGLGAAIIFDILAGRSAQSSPSIAKHLGFAPTTIPRGFLAGLGASAIILPPVYLIVAATEMVYRWVQFNHPAEHQLLHEMRQSVPQTRWVLIVGATIIAPLWEEFLFRAHVQTLIRRCIEVIGTPHPTPQGFAPIFPPAASVPLASPEIMPPLASPSAQPVALNVDQLRDRLRAPIALYLNQLRRRLRAAAPWLAIFLTSMFFAMVHDVWMWPPIFALSIGLGIVYERTGNLWSSITVHCLFNSVSTYLFLRYA